MNTSQLKSQLHESIENINNDVVLKTMVELSTHHYNILNEPELNQYQLKRLDEAKQQIASNNLYTHEQANELMDKWLKK